MNDSEAATTLTTQHSMGDDSRQLEPWALCKACRQLDLWRSLLSSLTVGVPLGCWRGCKCNLFRDFSKPCDLFTSWVLRGFLLEWEKGIQWNSFELGESCYTTPVVQTCLELLVGLPALSVGIKGLYHHGSSYLLHWLFIINLNNIVLFLKFLFSYHFELDWGKYL